jgi:spore maturation protein CgeB
MKILLVCMEYDYGDPARGKSYEYYNFYLSLQTLGYDVTLFDYMSEMNALGRSSMNEKLLTITAKIRPDVAMFSLYTDQFEPEIVDQLRQHTRTLCFFHDDTWRVEFSKFWARHFDFFTTPDVCGVKKYAVFGMPNTIYFPFSCNERLYRKIDIEEKFDISFVGAWHSYREWLINHLCREGINSYWWLPPVKRDCRA